MKRKEKEGWRKEGATGQSRKYTKVHEERKHTGEMIEHKEKESRIGGGIYREIGVRIMVTAMRKAKNESQIEPSEDTVEKKTRSTPVEKIHG